MELTDILDAYKLMDQIYLSMFTTAFALLLYFCRGIARNSTDVATWVGFYAIGIITTGYGLGISLYASGLLLQAFGLGDLPFTLVTITPFLAAIINGLLFIPIAAFTVRIAREENLRNSRPRAQYAK